MPVLKIADPAGRIRGIVFGYACHNTTLTGEFYQLSGDYAGFAAETRELKPHLTLSRIDPPASVRALLGSKLRFGTRMPVDSVILYRSRLGGGPARYEEIVRIALGR